MRIRHAGFRLALLSFLTFAVLAGCLGRSDEAAGAERALVGFFSNLSQGQYQAAAEIYGGSYEILQNYNPDLDPADLPALWERACRMNGFQCLEVKDLLEVEQIGEGVFQIPVTFLSSAGEVFQLGPCCGEDPSESPPLTEFIFRVALDKDGRYRVLDLPVYVP